MDDNVLIEFACTASRALGNATQVLADRDRTHQDSPKLIDFASRLFMVAEMLDQPHAGNKSIPIRKVVDYLSDLEKICRWPAALPAAKHPVAETHFSKLQAIKNRKLKLDHLLRPLRNLAASNLPREKLFKNMSRMIPRDRSLNPPLPEPENVPVELAIHIYDDVYKILDREVLCGCPTATKAARDLCLHQCKLKLTRDEQSDNEEAILEAAFRASESHGPESIRKWSLVRILLPKNPKSSRLRWAGDDDASICEQKNLSQKVFKSPANAICHVLLRRWGAVCHQLRVQDHDLLVMDDILPPVQKLPRDVVSKSSISLEDMLKTQRLSDDAKILLSCTLAYSVWKFYGTQFMQKRWNAAEIHFMAEEAARGEATAEVHIRPAHSFVPLDFSHLAKNLDTIENEYVKGQGLLHWAPRIFALGMTLVHLLADEPVKDTSADYSWQERANEYYFDCDQLLNHAQWPCITIKNPLVRRGLKEAVATCLDGNAFKNTSDLQARKAILHKQVVQKLQYVVQISNAQEKNALCIAKNDPSNASNKGQTLESGMKYDSSAFRVLGTAATYTGNEARDHARMQNGNITIQGNYYENYVPSVPTLSDSAIK